MAVNTDSFLSDLQQFAQVPLPGLQTGPAHTGDHGVQHPPAAGHIGQPAPVQHPNRRRNANPVSDIRWHNLVRDSLVEVTDQSGRRAVIARHVLAKNQSNDEATDYQNALKYILKLLKDDPEGETTDEFIRENPRVRLEAEFEDLPNVNGHSLAGFGHAVIIDPNSWNEVWKLADRINVLY